MMKPSKRAASVRRVEAVLDRLCRYLVVELRDRNTCQRCGATALTHKIDWSHVVTRGAKSIRWTEWNSKALCAGCHRWWGSHPLEASTWFREKFPERVILMEAWRQQRSRPKIDRGLVRLYLEAEIAKHGGQA